MRKWLDRLKRPLLYQLSYRLTNERPRICHSQRVSVKPRTVQALYFPQRTRRAGYFFSGMNLNFWPPTLASYIKPPFAIVNTSTPC